MAQNKDKDDFLISEDGELVAARLEPKLKARLEAKCKANFRTVSDTLRLIVQQYVDAK